MRRTLIVFILLSITYLNALDVVKYEKGQSLLDVRVNYKMDILTDALAHTKDIYGDYEITTDAPVVNNLQALNQLKSGRLLNVFIASANSEWDKELIPVKVPIRKGLLSYRLLLINREDLELFSNVNNIDDLSITTNTNMWFSPN